MAFRADEKTKEGRETAVHYLITQGLPAGDRARSEGKLHELINHYGPVVDCYPCWHPLISCASVGERTPSLIPQNLANYRGLDHTVYLRNAFITCPYGDGQSIFDSVGQLAENPVATIRAEKIEAPLYSLKANPILVSCEWSARRPMEQDGTIPKSIAVPLLLEKILPHWHTDEVAETWETMRPNFLGSPRGSRSSLFVNQETGQVLKNIWNALIYTGMFGPLYVG